MNLNTSFTRKQLEEMSAQNLTFLIVAYATLLNKTKELDIPKLENLCRISKKDKVTKMVLVDGVLNWQFDFNDHPCNYSALKKIDQTSIPEYLETIAKQSLIQIVNYIPFDKLSQLNPNNYREIVVSELTREQKYKKLQLYSAYLPKIKTQDDLTKWKQTVKILDNVLKELIFSNEDYLNYLMQAK